MFNNKKKAAPAVKNGVVCVSFWIDKKTLDNYKKRYPRTLSQLVRYYITAALKNENIVKNACWNNNETKNTIFSED